MSRFVLRLTFAGAVSSDAVIQHLLETFNDDGSLVEAVAKSLTPSVAEELHKSVRCARFGEGAALRFSVPKQGQLAGSRAPRRPKHD